MLGSMVAFGVHPVNFLLDNYKKVCTIIARRGQRACSRSRARRARARASQYGEVFTILLFGRKMTYFMTPDAADFFFNARHEDVSAELAYAPITVPVFGKDVVYDVPYAVLVEQKKYVTSHARVRVPSHAHAGHDALAGLTLVHGPRAARDGPRATLAQDDQEQLDSRDVSDLRAAHRAGGRRVHQVRVLS